MKTITKFTRVLRSATSSFYNHHLHYYHLAFSFIFIILLSSCDKEIDLPETQETSIDTSLELNDKNYIETASLGEKLAYRDLHLSNLVEQLAVVNPDFAIEGSKSAKNEDSAFYLENLLVSSFKNNNSTSSKSEGLTSLDAFKDLEGETWYPTLKLERKGDGDLKRAMFLFPSYDERSGEEIVEAYVLKENGKMKLLHKRYTEEMFLQLDVAGKENPTVYSISLAACPPNPQIQMPSAALIPVDCGGGGGGGGSTTDKIQYMKIKDKKESWIEKADVHFIVNKYDAVTPGVLYNTCPDVQLPYCDLDGRLIRKYSEKEVNNKTNILVNYGINNSQYNPAVFQYTIFEYDSWPAGRRVYQRTVNGATLQLGFRSYQTPYATQTFTLAAAGTYGLANAIGFSENNSGIEYNLR